MNFDREKFFAGYRAAFGSLNESQVGGLNFLLGKLEQDSFSLKQIAYILATVDHETDHTFQPVKEKRERANSPRRKNQDRYWLTGEYGRGYVQITWDVNYRKFGLGPDERDKALEPETAYQILSRGMREGLFTGKKLSNFINGSVNFYDARTIINGHDKATEIANRAVLFTNILNAAQSQLVSLVSEGEVKPTASVPVIAEEPTPTDPAGQGIVAGVRTHYAAIVGFLTSTGAGVISWVQGASTVLILGFFGASALIGMTYIIGRFWFRNKENDRVAKMQDEREKRAHEITILKMKSAMDPNALTVEVSHEPVSPAPREEVKE